MNALQTITRHSLVMDHSVDAPYSAPYSAPPSPGTPPPSPHFLTKDKRRRHSDFSFRRRSKVESEFPSMKRQKSCYSSLPQLSCVDKSDLTHWSEYTVRKSLAKFRTRKSATKTLKRRRSGEKPQTPSKTINSILQSRYEIVRRDDVSQGQRLLAVFYCWFYGCIIDVYYSITDEGRERSFLKWFISCVLVTVAAIGVFVLAAVAFYHANSVILDLMNAGVNFAVFLMTLILGVLGTLAVLNFD